MLAVVLFDIDGTLITVAGAGRAALDAAVSEVTGVAGSLAGVAIAGRTDHAIISDALANANVSAEDHAAVFRGVTEAYARHLPGHVASAEGAVLPGVAALLAAMDSAAIASTLATGNLRVGAQIKLHHFGLWRLGFEAGGFGDDSPVRADVVRAAMLAHARREHAKFVVIGDTPHDITAAHAAGARAVAVATGTFTSEELRVAGADVVFSNLAETSSVLDAILSG